MAGKASKWRHGVKSDARRYAHEGYYCEYCGKVVPGSSTKVHLRHFREEYVKISRPVAKVPASSLPSASPRVDCIEARHLGDIEGRDSRSPLRQFGDWIAKVVIAVAAIIISAATLGYIKKLR